MFTAPVLFELAEALVELAEDLVELAIVEAEILISLFTPAEALAVLETLAVLAEALVVTLATVLREEVLALTGLATAVLLKVEELVAGVDDVIIVFDDVAAFEDDIVVAGLVFKGELATAEMAVALGVD